MEIALGCGNQLFDRNGLTHKLRLHGINLPEPIVQAGFDCALAREARNHLTVEAPAMVACTPLQPGHHLLMHVMKGDCGHRVCSLH